MLKMQLSFSMIKEKFYYQERPLNEAEGGEQVGQKDFGQLVCDEAQCAEGATVFEAKEATEARPAESVRLKRNEKGC
ncbi:hypothetical protein HNQ44_001880 [Planomicrobium koreense]|uniref:Uncharacterized protein n=1 Tax=Planococcus koreensis TaxID=112331 RepID=A0A7W8CUG9_9BACL|nr:hypothetical protein [Planococcus koreensis]MBB5180452.1 hypothetical protein [Planococcus koreensis]